MKKNKQYCHFLIKFLHCHSFRKYILYLKTTKKWNNFKLSEE